MLYPGKTKLSDLENSFEAMNNLQRAEKIATGFRTRKALEADLEAVEVRAELEWLQADMIRHFRKRGQSFSHARKMLGWPNQRRWKYIQNVYMSEVDLHTHISYAPRRDELKRALVLHDLWTERLVTLAELIEQAKGIPKSTVRKITNNHPDFEETYEKQGRI